MISSFPLYIDPGQPGAPGSVERFRKDTGINLRYVEDVNEVRQFFARIRPQLAAGQPLAQDLVVLTSWMAERLIRLGWVEPLPLEEVPNARHSSLRCATPPGIPSSAIASPGRRALPALPTTSRPPAVNCAVSMTCSIPS